MIRLPFYAVTAAMFLTSIAAAQEAQAPQAIEKAPPLTAKQAAEESKPLPEPGKLIELARSHSEAWRAAVKGYICKQTVIQDEFDSHGNNKGKHTDEYSVFFVGTTEIHQHVSRDGKPLSPSDEAKEKERVDKAVEKARKHEEEPENKAAPPPRLALLLKVTTLSNERREIINDRPTIIFDYTGNPKAKADNITENVMKHLSGHIWIDEDDAATARLDGELQENFHVAGGLLVNVKKGGKFAMDWTRVNGDRWFLHTLDANADGRILLFKGFNGETHVNFHDYRKLKTTITIQPGVRLIDENGQPMPEVVDPSTVSTPPPPPSKPQM